MVMYKDMYYLNFMSKQSIIFSSAVNLLKSSGLSVLEGIDPNAENHVAATIINTKSSSIGVLIRLEPNIPVSFILPLASTKKVISC